MGILRRIINIIFPAVCKQCNSPISSDTPTAYFCNKCWDGVKWFDCLCCPRCGMPYPSIDSPSIEKGTDLFSLEQGKINLSPFRGHLCGSCCKNPPYFDKAVSAGPYTGVLAEAIKLFKYKKKIHIGRALADRMIMDPGILFPRFNKGAGLPLPRSIATGRGGFENKQTCYIIPVPLHPKRLREREFNQSAIIASVIGARLGIPVSTDILIRQRHTKPQVELNMKERRKNVVGAFTVQSREVIADKDIVLVDDVYTTGSTVNECARVLKKNGVKLIYVVTIARMAG